MSHPIWTQMSTKYSLYAVGSRIHNAYGWGQNLHVRAFMRPNMGKYGPYGLAQNRRFRIGDGIVYARVLFCLVAVIAHITLEDLDK